MQMLTSLRRHGAALALASLVLAGCGSDDSSGPDSSLANSVISNVSLVGTTGTVTFREESAPSGNAGGPAATVSVQSAAVIGGSAQVDITAPAEFQRIIVALADLEGYYEISLNSPVSAATLALTVDEDVDVDELLARIAVAAGAGGSLGAYDDAPIAVITTVGTGDVQVSVSWDTPADVDLYVVDPTGEELYYGSRVGENGELDLDSNASCSGPDKRNENVTFPEPAPRGTYTVRVNYWDSCDASSTSYVVTVRVRGQQTRTFSGTLTGAGVGGGAGAGSVVTTFTY